MRDLPQTTYFRPVAETLLSNNWAVLTKHEYDFKRGSGEWQRQVREVFDRGHGATCLLHNPDTDTVLLTRQFRLPLYGKDHDGFLIEAPAGLLEGASPADRMRLELEEETGFSVSKLEHLFDVFMSPGSVTEYIVCFSGTYCEADKVSDGGGEHAEGEDIEVLHISLKNALAMIDDGRIRDAKTIILLQRLALKQAGLC